MSSLGSPSMPLNHLVQTSDVVRVYADLAGAYPMHDEGRDDRNWSDELVLRVDTHVIETQQIAKCSDGQMLPDKCLFPGRNAITTLISPEHFDVRSHSGTGILPVHHAKNGQDARSAMGAMV